MIRLKPHLENVVRKAPAEKNRCDFLRLDMNEDPVGLPGDFIADTLNRMTPSYLSAYPEYAGLLSKIAAHNDVSADNICLSNGSDGAIKYLFDAYIAPGDKVLLTDPTFAMYPVYAKIAGAESILFSYENDLSFAVDGFLDLIDDSVRMAVIVNPNNPVGSVLPETDIKRVVEKCKEHDVLAVVDEAYFYFYNKTAIPLVRQYDNVLVLRTFSKLCGLANVRIGYAVSTPRVVSHLGKVKPTFDVSGFAVFMAENLLDSPQVIEAKMKEINKGKSYLTTRLARSGLTYKTGEANFVLVKCGYSVSEVVREMHENGILIAGGFEHNALKDWVRVTVGSVETMERFWKIFYEVIHKGE